MNNYNEDVIEITEEDVKVEEVKEDKTFIDKHFDKFLLGGLGLIILLSGLNKSNKNKAINAQSKLQAFMDGYYLGTDSSKKRF